MTNEGLYFYPDFEDSITITTIAGSVTPSIEEVREQYEKGRLVLGSHYWVGTKSPSGNVKEGPTIRYVMLPEPSAE